MPPLLFDTIADILLSFLADKTPQIRNGDTGDWIGTFLGHKGAVWSCKIDAYSRTLAATASGDFTARLWCATTGKELVELKHKHVVKSVDFSMDSSKIATGCQDGLMRIYDTVKAGEKVDPQEYKIVHNVQDGITKVSWSLLDKDLVLVGKKASTIEKWDHRMDASAGPVQSTKLSSNATVMDFEENKTHNILLTASGTKVHALAADTLQVIKEYDMPNPMNFLNEGGVTLSSDGSKFYAVSGSSLFFLVVMLHNYALIITGIL